MSQRLATRRTLLRALSAAAIAPLALAVSGTADAQSLPPVQVWKSPTCGCCGDWIKHMEAAGFKVTATNVPTTHEIRSRLGMGKYGSCHTAVVGDYVLEGHVPAADVKRLLREKPRAVGIAVPNMPIGSPGMDGPIYKGQKDPYDVLLVQRDGSARVFASYNKR